MGTNYDVALSFAGEDRTYVEMVADCLKDHGVRAFYDRFELTDLWGKDLQDHFTAVFGGGARFVVLFVSSHYAAKIWTKLELRAALAEAMKRDAEYVLPARFDDTELPGLIHTTAHLDLRAIAPYELCLRIREKLGHNVRLAKADFVSSPRSPAERGRAAFNYSSFNGRYRIGKPPYEFETRWSKASNTSIHCYTDTTNLRGLALAPKEKSIEQVDDMNALDFTSRVRTPEIGRVLILQNKLGYFAALNIVSIKDDSRGDTADELVFDYVILTDGRDQYNSACSQSKIPSTTATSWSPPADGSASTRRKSISQPCSQDSEWD